MLVSDAFVVISIACMYFILASDGGDQKSIGALQLLTATNREHRAIHERSNNTVNMFLIQTIC